ncbi:MAG: ABC transporter ATP-binding protein/permease, partial [Oscillospiraceae bacterium]|nr:ABC transporter ATP-binding protein/permease [Oscillospiraceae bacterium]
MSDTRDDVKLTARERRSIILRAIKLNEQADRGFTLRLVMCAILSLANEYLFILLISFVTNGIASGRELGNLLASTAAIVAVCLTTQIAVKFIKRRENSHKAKHDMRLRSILNEKMINMDYVHLENPDMQNRYNMCMNYLFGWQGVTSVPTVMGDIVVAIFRIIIGAVLIIPSVIRGSGGDGFAGFITSPLGFLAVVAVVTVSEFIKNLYFIKKTFYTHEDVMRDKRHLLSDRTYSAYMNYVVNNYRSGKEIRLYAEQELILGEMQRCTDENHKLWLGAFFKWYNKYGIGVEIMNLISGGVMYGYAILRAIYGVLSAGEVIAFVMLFTRVLRGITGISNELTNFKLSAGHCRDVFDFLDIPDEKYRGTIPTEKRSDNKYEFEFRHVWFKYPGSEQYVLRDINLKWRIGEKMALVGRNGCGKSTLVKLLCRLYDPTKGEITLNGVDIRKYDYEEYMALFAVVFQDSKLFSFSVAENVAASTGFDAERVEDCVRRSGLSERLDGLPEGIRTYLYKDFDEHGVEISGGEMQKICLARAIYKGSPFIVLDEPTAALDPISEHDIYTKFNGIVGTRTAIYISHRLSSCRFCDE